MLFRQFVDEDLGCASYLVGDDVRARGSYENERRDGATSRDGER